MIYAKFYIQVTSQISNVIKVIQFALYVYIYMYYTAPSGKPKNFNAVPNITFITVEWSAPDLWKRNGIITHYVIEWGETENLITLNYPVPNPTFNTTDDQRYTFRDLKPNVRYTFNIAAVNINGTGPILNKMNTTLEESMQFVVYIYVCTCQSCFIHTHVKHISYLVPGLVRNLMKTASTDNSVTISWNPPLPSDGYTNIEYIIKYGVLNEDTKEVTTTNTQERINNLGRGS